jgi:uncharacterized metal-binding protein YceD (DUF177 family)
VSEFSRPIAIDRLPPGESLHEISATAEECAALAQRFSLLALDRFEAKVRLARLAGGLIRLEAELLADLLQECVVTLVPVATRIEDRFKLLYGEAQDEASEVTLSGEAELVEPLQGGAIDVGEAVAQQLSLAIDPFPRAPGTEEAPAADGSAKPSSPFAVLANWRQKS